MLHPSFIDDCCLLLNLIKITIVLIYKWSIQITPLLLNPWKQPLSETAWNGRKRVNCSSWLTWLVWAVLFGKGQAQSRSRSQAGSDPNPDPSQSQPEVGPREKGRGGRSWSWSRADAEAECFVFLANSNPVLIRIGRSKEQKEERSPVHMYTYILKI